MHVRLRHLIIIKTKNNNNYNYNNYYNTTALLTFPVGLLSSPEEITMKNINKTQVWYCCDYILLITYTTYYSTTYVYIATVGPTSSVCWLWYSR